jgi:YesN/AraC family two-component response regulator
MMNDQQSYDVILLDYRMPEMNGIEAAKILKRYRPQTKIVMTTGYDFVRQQAADLGIPFLQKPYSMEHLAECLNKLNL